MKTQIRYFCILALATAVSAFAAKPMVGPSGGRILTTAAPHAEFFVEADRTVSISFYDEDSKPLAPGNRVVNVIAQAEAGRAKLDFTKTAQGFTSTQPLPEGDGYTVVVQIRDHAGAKPTNHRVVFHDEICDECNRAEYACICDENGGHEH